MRSTFRVVVAFALAFFLFLVKGHLESIDSQRQATADSVPRFVRDDAGAHIELVPIGSSSPTTSQAVTYQSTKTYLQPTNPPISPTKFQSKQIPVQVPGAELWDDEYEDEDDYFDRDLDFGIPVGRQSKPKPKPSPPKSEESAKPLPPRPSVSPLADRIIVTGRFSWESTKKHFTNQTRNNRWQRAVYVVNDQEAEYHVQQNKGKESNIYLQYIVDHYNKLPQYIVFLHSHRKSYHVEFEEQDNVLTVQRLQLDYVKKTGYANLRCDWGPGCPDEVHPFRQNQARTTEIAFAGAWMQIFNNSNIPEIVAAPCCAQFAVSREQVHARPLSEYQNFLRWIMETELDDETSGRVFEYLWHIIFGQDPVSCPSKAQCYKDIYDMEYVEPVDRWAAFLKDLKEDYDENQDDDDDYDDDLSAMKGAERAAMHPLGLAGHVQVL
ncbi:hypothetical protein N7495_001373 [Penicillium taxi]|uniref:uncharacterized protein n=1 Tax=Penicillium taxi TaxID=168475 RepID=UPI00254524B0|nr:uncharacterized protein N7495_001373 [Penicillium taxi]KAJ5908691.1 hypothetical protein N7495_001373 [Penicillium taxi]